VLLIVGLELTPAIAAEDEAPLSVIAAQIRSQGFACNSAQSATRDVQASRPNELVWVLQCKQDTYRVHLVPHMAAKVERVEG
jgi:hypothetical protein